MKASCFLIICTVVFSFQACNDEKKDDSGTAALSRQEIKAIVEPYLFLEDSVYYFRLSEEKALEFGISKEQYLTAKKEVNDVNIFLDSLRRNPDGRKLILGDPQVYSKKNKLQ
jgi:hypothetical protein